MKTVNQGRAMRIAAVSPTTHRVVIHALTLVCVAVGSGLLLTAQQPQPVGTWAQTAEQVADSRIGAASLVLPDGRTLIAGGLANGQAVASIVIYDPLTNTLVAAGEMTAARVRHTATLLDDGRVIFAGGRVAGDVTTDLEVFSLHEDPAQSSSAWLGTMHTAREGHAAAKLADGSLLIAGGANAAGPLDTAEIFDPVTNTVQATWHPMGTKRAGASATRLIDGRVLIAGGTTRDADGGIRDLASAELYQPVMQAFSPAATEMSVPRSGHTAVMLPFNGSVLIAGGSSNGAVVASVDLFRPAEFPDSVSVGTGQFGPTGAMLAARHAAIAGPTADAGVAFVAGGAGVDQLGASIATANAEAYRFATITTDKADYYPGETVFITGSGWVPGETVSLLLQEWENEHSDRFFMPVAEADGTIAASFLVEPHHLGVRFYLTAQGAESKAQITFTDAPRIGAVTVGAQNPNPLSAAAGNSATYSVAIARGNNGIVNAGMSLTWDGPAPPGVTFAFTPGIARSTGNDAFPAVTLTLTTNGATAAGTYGFTVKAADGPDVSTGGAGTLVVVPACTAPSITTEPSDVSITYGSNGVFTAGATGVPTPMVQWQVKTNGGADWADLSGQNGATLTLVAPPVALSGQHYRAVFNNDCSDDPVPTSAATLTVGAASVTGNFTADNKVYDGTSTAVVLSRSLSGSVGEDDVNLVGGTASFVDANAGTGKMVSLSGASLSGADAGNYALASVATATADILKATATIDVDGYSAPYDGASHGATGSATGVLSETLAGLDLGERFTNVPGGTVEWTFSDPTGNYHDASGTAEVVITALTVNGIFTVANKVYDGSTTATILTRGLPAGVVGTDDVTLTGGTATFDTSAVGTAKSVTGAGFALAGARAGNYQLGAVAQALADITAKELTVAGITASNKPWDGSNVATLNVAGAALVGVIGGDAVTLNTAAAVGTFVNTSVGTWNVIVAGLTISGTSSGNYTLTQPTTTASVDAWHMAGFHQPVGAVNSIALPPGAPLPTGNAVTLWHMIKGGNTVPLKFNVFTAEGGTELTTPGTVVASFQAWRLPSCAGGTAEDLFELGELSAGGTVLRYDAMGGQFIQNWQTPKAGGTDMCYRATVTMKDGSTLTAFFKVRK